jgi:sec-independent protein translocase protein TatA
MDGLVGHWWVLVIILFIVLIVWGPGKMPDMGAGMGRAIREFRSAVSGGRDSAANVTQADSVNARLPEPTVSSVAAPANPAAIAPDDTRPR